VLLTSLLLSLCSRLLVSASQDGKLIIWDSYTTNKVGTADHDLDQPGQRRVFKLWVHLRTVCKGEGGGAQGCHF